MATTRLPAAWKSDQATIGAGARAAAERACTDALSPRGHVPGLKHPLIFLQSFQCSRIARPATTRPSSPGGATRTACRP